MDYILVSVVIIIILVTFIVIVRILVMFKYNRWPVCCS